MEESYPVAGSYSTSGSRRTMSAFYDDEAAAQRAVDALRSLGVSEASVRMTGGDEYRDRDVSDRGFWGMLSDLFFPDDDQAVYGEGLRRGGYLVTATDVPEDLHDRALDILDVEGAVDLDERVEAWRAEGWTGTTPQTAAGVGTGAGTGSMAAEIDASADTGGPASADLSGPAAVSGGSVSDTSGGARGDEEVIPVVEERLRVGKRDVSIGRVRVRSYVVEEPVSEDVRLSRERVDVERRPVDRPLTEGEAAFTDRTLEAEERAEEAVVSKDQRVTEEVALRRETEERTETVEDSVRRTEVEVEDERGNVSRLDQARRGA